MKDLRPNFGVRRPGFARVFLVAAADDQKVGRAPIGESPVGGTVRLKQHSPPAPLFIATG